MNEAPITHSVFDREGSRLDVEVAEFKQYTGTGQADKSVTLKRLVLARYWEDKCESRQELWFSQQEFYKLISILELYATSENP